MDYFVTGGTGFIGRYLVERLLKREGTVYVLVREGSRGRLEEEALGPVRDLAVAATLPRWAAADIPLALGRLDGGHRNHVDGNRQFRVCLAATVNTVRCTGQ